MKKCMFIKDVCVLLVSESDDVSFSLIDRGLVVNKLLNETDRWSTDNSGELETEKMSGECAYKKEYMFIKERDYFRRIDFLNILWIEASGSYCCLHLRGEPKIMLSFNLSELSGHLPERYFVRVHRSYIVNIDHIDSFIGNLLCIGKDKIPISKQHKAFVVARLNVLGNIK